MNNILGNQDSRHPIRAGLLMDYEVEEMFEDGTLRQYEHKQAKEFASWMEQVSRIIPTLPVGDKPVWVE